MRRTALVCCLLFAGTVAIYLPVRDHEFVNYDDRIYVVENPNLGSGLAGVVRAFAAPYENNWIPLTWISLQIDHAFFGREPAGYHLVNVALHAASGVLLLLALLRMTGALGPSAFVAGVFALHPLHVESVAWAAERKDVLSGLFWMLTLHAYVSWVRRPQSLLRHAGVGACLLLGLLAKPVGVTLPFALLLLDYWPLGRLRGEGGGPWPDPARLRRALREKLPWFALVAVFCAVAFQVQRATGAMAEEPILPLAFRLQNAVHAYAWYAMESVWPHGLAVFYPHPLRSLPAAQTAALAVGLGALTALAARAAARHPCWIVGWLWFLGTLVPMIGVVQVGMQARADRYTYIPLIGLALAVAWGTVDLFGRRRRGRAALAVASLAALLALAACTARQIPHWRDSEALFRRALAVTDANFLAHQGLASELLLQGRSDEAREHLEAAARLKPRWSAPPLKLGELLERQGDLAGAMEHYRRALALAPRNARTHESLAIALLEDGQTNRAVRHLRRALELARESSRARLHARLGRALAVQGDLEAAIASYRSAVDLNPELGEAFANLGLALLRTGRAAEADPALRRARALGVESAELEAALGQRAMERGEADAAIGHYRAALALEGGSRIAANNLAWLLATGPSRADRDRDEAIRIAREMAGASDTPHPAVLDTLAAGLAAAGRFDEALAVGEQAAAQARARGDAALAAAIETRLALYRAGRPYVESLR